MRDGVGELPAELAGLGVRDQDCWAVYSLQEGGEGGVVEEGGGGSVALVLELAGVEGVEDGVAGEACAGPLGVVFCLGVGEGGDFFGGGEVV